MITEFYSAGRLAKTENIFKLATASNELVKNVRLVVIIVDYVWINMFPSRVSDD